MEIIQTRSRVRAIILSLTGIIIVLLFIRFLLDLARANPDVIFVRLLQDISDVFLLPFNGLVSIAANSELRFVNFDALIAIACYAIIGVIIAELFTSFIQQQFEDVIINIIDALFKVVEAILFIRIVFDLLEIDRESSFAKIIYDATNWADGLIFPQEFLDEQINVSAILVLIIVVILDVTTEGFLESLLQPKKQHPIKRVTTTTVQKTPQPAPQQQPQQIHQHFHIQTGNTQQPPRPAIPRQVVAVPPQARTIAPPPQKQSLPYHPNQQTGLTNNASRNPQRKQTILQKIQSRLRKMFRS